jgi:hypothetical protein
MSDLSSKCCLIFDHGLFTTLAERLARPDGFGRVLYHSPFEEGFSKLNSAILGYGLPGVERCNDIWVVKNEIDCAIFPDIEHAGLQLELESQGIPVWGSRKGDTLELLREKFHAALERVGLDVPKFRVCTGMTELRSFLKDNAGPFFIKISKWRGSFETQKFRSWKLDEGLLDIWAVKFGPAKEIVPFMVFDPIETELEIGGDTFGIDGQWPDLMLHGDENKDKAYIAAVTKREEMPQQLQEVLDAFSVILKDYRYRNFWSMEVRVKDDKAYFGDATTRAPQPATPSQLENIKNLPAVIYAGAQGELLQPEFEQPFTCEVIVNMKGDRHAWGVTEVPDSLKRWLKLPNSCELDGLRCFPPDEQHGEAIGWMVAIGATVEEMIETMKQQIKELPDGMSADVQPLGELLTIVKEGEKVGIEFNGEVPGPEVVMENS